MSFRKCPDEKSAKEKAKSRWGRPPGRPQTQRGRRLDKLEQELDHLEATVRNFHNLTPLDQAQCLLETGKVHIRIMREALQ